MISKSDKNKEQVPLGTVWSNRSQKTRQGQEKVVHFGKIWDRIGSPSGAFWDQGGSRKGSKIDLARIGRHLDRPNRTKSALQEGVQKMIQKTIETVSKNYRFWDAKNIKKYCKVIKNQGFAPPRKVSKNESKMTPK